MRKITTKNIKDIRLWEDNPQKDRTSFVARIDFNFPCTWTILTIDELLILLEKWIEGEERRYPPGKGFQGRKLLFNRIQEVFNEGIDAHDGGLCAPVREGLNEYGRCVPISDRNKSPECSESQSRV